MLLKQQPLEGLGAPPCCPSSLHECRRKYFGSDIVLHGTMPMKGHRIHILYYTGYGESKHWSTPCAGRSQTRLEIEIVTYYQNKAMKYINAQPTIFDHININYIWDPHGKPYIDSMLITYRDSQNV